MTDTSLVTFEEIQLQSAHIKNYVDNKVGTSGGGAAKVEGATAGNIAIFDSDGRVIDSAFKIADLQGTGGSADVEVVPEEIFIAYLNEIFPLDKGVVTSDTLVFDKVFNVEADSFLYI